MDYSTFSSQNFDKVGAILKKDEGKKTKTKKQKRKNKELVGGEGKLNSDA